MCAISHTLLGRIMMEPTTPHQGEDPPAHSSAHRMVHSHCMSGTQESFPLDKWQKLQRVDPNRQLIVGIANATGSWKSWSNHRTTCMPWINALPYLHGAHDGKGVQFAIVICDEVDHAVRLRAVLLRKGTLHRRLLRGFHFASRGVGHFLRRHAVRESRLLPASNECTVEMSALD